MSIDRDPVGCLPEAVNFFDSPEIRNVAREIGAVK